MPLEIERRLLLKRAPQIKFDECHVITQAYGPNGRVRKSHITYSANKRKHKYYVTKYALTVKKRIDAGVYEEMEVEISEKEFNTELAQSKKFLKKTRFIKKVGKYKWEVDIFENMSLIITEIEVKTKKELKTVPIPKFIAKEMICDITGDKNFSNFNLAEKIKKKKKIW